MLHLFRLFYLACIGITVVNKPLLGLYGRIRRLCAHLIQINDLPPRLPPSSASTGACGFLQPPQVCPFPSEAAPARRGWAEGTQFTQTHAAHTQQQQCAMSSINMTRINEPSGCGNIMINCVCCVVWCVRQCTSQTRRRNTNWSDWLRLNHSNPYGGG